MSALFRSLAGAALIGGGIGSMIAGPPFPTLIIAGVFLSLSGLFDMLAQGRSNG